MVVSWELLNMVSTLICTKVLPPERPCHYESVDMGFPHTGTLNLSSLYFDVRKGSRTQAHKALGQATIPGSDGL